MTDCSLKNCRIGGSFRLLTVKKLFGFSCGYSVFLLNVYDYGTFKRCFVRLMADKFQIAFERSEYHTVSAVLLKKEVFGMFPGAANTVFGSDNRFKISFFGKA